MTFVIDSFPSLLIKGNMTVAIERYFRQEIGEVTAEVISSVPVEMAETQRKRFLRTQRAKARRRGAHRQQYLAILTEQQKLFTAISAGVPT